MNKDNKEKKICNYPDCELEGDYRAPLGYENLSNYQWFCLEHIKEFNKSWNYHNQMNSDQIENDIRFDTIWRRPTKSFGSGAKFYNFTINGEIWVLLKIQIPNNLDIQISYCGLFPSLI